MFPISRSSGLLRPARRAGASLSLAVLSTLSGVGLAAHAAPGTASAKAEGAAPAASAAAAPAAALLGKWARSPEDCKRPELNFKDKSVEILIDADGRAVGERYPKVAYAVAGNIVTVALHKPHPYAQTRKKDELDFMLMPDGTLQMQVTKFEPTAFVRCR